MTKPKQKKTSKIMPRKIKTIIFSVIAILAALVALAILLKDIEKNIWAQEQKGTLEQSQKAIRTVYDNFAYSIVGSKEYIQPPETSCSKIGSVNVTEYTCGSSFTIAVRSIDEEQYKTLNRQLVSVYQSNNDFTRTKVYEPELSDYNKKISAIAGGSFENSEVKCYVSSEYTQDSQTAVFNGGCNLVSESLIFPLES